MSPATPDGDPGAPDFTDPVVGFRAWRLDEDGQLVPWTLASAGAWTPGVNTAACHFARFAGHAPARRHRPPAHDCMCGLYALHDPSDPRIAPGVDCALGAVVAWGDLEVHTTGWRAEHACVVALALRPGAQRAERARLEQAAARYRVALVPQDRLAAAAAEHGAPLPAFDALPRRARRRGARLGEQPPWSLPPAPALAPGGAVGFDVRAHVWVETAGQHALVGVTRPFAALLARARTGADTGEATPVQITAAAPGTVLAAGDVLARLRVGRRTFLAWAPVSGEVVEVSANADRLLSAPEGHGWLARLRPTRWAAEADALRWGVDARRAYLVSTRGAPVGAGDPFADLRAERITALPRVGSWGEVLDALRAAKARPTPRFADAADLYDRLGVDLGCALHEDAALADRLGRLETTLAFAVREPDARVTLDLRGDGPQLTLGARGPAADVELACTAETAHRLLRGDLDAAAALRAGELTTTASAGRTLAVLSVLKGVGRAYARRAAPDPSPDEIAARRLGLAVAP